jgi:hypothetical protein
MDLNLMRRRLERKVARDIVKEFMANVTIETGAPQMEYITEHATGAPAYNGQSHFGRADSGMATV